MTKADKASALNKILDWAYDLPSDETSEEIPVNSINNHINDQK